MEIWVLVECTRLKLPERLFEVVEIEGAIRQA
jgi:hypothetical protein